MSKLKPIISRRGDTIIEVTFCFVVFILVSAISVSMMNRSYAKIQNSLQITTVRNEIDAQAEALRFIHESYISERALVKTSSQDDSGKWQEYRAIWDRLTSFNNGMSNSPTDISKFEANKCSEYYDKNNIVGDNHNIFADKAFILNTRKLKASDPENTILSAKDHPEIFQEAPLAPRLVFSSTSTAGTSNGEDTETTNLNEINDGTNYKTTPVFNNLYRAEGIWIVAVRDFTNVPSSAHFDAKYREDMDKNYPPEFYDFHIRTCWYGPGETVPTTIGTIIRLYNPDYMKRG